MARSGAGHEGDARPGARRARATGRRRVGAAVTCALLACGLAVGAGSAAATPATPHAPVPPPGPTSPPPATTLPAPATTTPAPPTTLPAPAAGPATPTTTTSPTTLPAPAAGAPARYVALGDSWAAGTAAGDLDRTSGTCRRSLAAYPRLVAAAAPDAPWLSRACSAREANSGNTQFTSLGAEVRAITATVGADAVGLGEMLRACSRAGTPRTCDQAATHTEKTLGVLGGNLDTAIAEMRRSAPRAAVTFVGYPLPAEGLSCPTGPADAARAARADAAVTRLDTILRERVLAAKLRFVDVRAAFKGHGVCAAKPWLTAWNGPEARLAGAPNREGHASGYEPGAAEAVVAALADPSSVPAPPDPDVQRVGRSSGPALFPG